VSDTLRIGVGFNGPRLSGNGGYVGGRLAELLGRDRAVEVTFRAPIPLEQPMTVERTAADRLLLRHGETLVCEAAESTLDELVPPGPPDDWAEVARRGRDGGSGSDSEFGTCIVCGRERAVGDGLRVLGEPGPGAGRSLSCYVAHPHHAEADGRIGFPLVWGTLDCPGAWAAQDPDDWRPALTGRMTAQIFERPRAGERCAVVGWRLGVDGRKLHSATALYAEDGRLLALARQLWIVLREGS